MNPMQENTQQTAESIDDGTVDLVGLLIPLLLHWKHLVLGSVLAGLIALGSSYLIPKTYTSRTVFLPPQQQQSAAASALAQLGALSGLAGVASGVRTPGDQYVAMLQSQTVADRLVDAYDLMKVYEADYRFEARKELAANSRISLGRKDGLITIEVDDRDPQRAADMANRYVDELRRMTNDLALTEAQQRRAFFEQHMRRTKEKLTQAQAALQASGFNQGTLRAEPRAAAEQYARLRSEVTAAEVRLQMLRGAFANNAPEVANQAAALSALRAQLARTERAADASDGAGYVEKYREFKYQETLFDLFARQYELARVDESKEGALIQVVDVATPPEKKSKPRRTLIAAGTAVAALVVMIAALLLQQAWRRTFADTRESSAAMRLRAAVRSR